MYSDPGESIVLIANQSPSRVFQLGPLAMHGGRSNLEWTAARTSRTSSSRRALHNNSPDLAMQRLLEELDSVVIGASFD